MESDLKTEALEYFRPAIAVSSQKYSLIIFELSSGTLSVALESDPSSSIFFSHSL
jgi:hypothetical protein